MSYTDKHHIIKRHLFKTRHYLQNLQWLKNHEFNLVDVEHYTHINEIHNETPSGEKARYRLYNKLYSRNEIMLEDEVIDELTFTALNDVHYWCTINCWDKNKVPYGAFKLLEHM